MFDLKFVRTTVHNFTIFAAIEKKRNESCQKQVLNKLLPLYFIQKDITFNFFPKLYF